MFTLANIGKDYNFKISKNKTKVMAFTGNDPIRTMIILENKPIEQISHVIFVQWSSRMRHILRIL